MRILFYIGKINTHVNFINKLTYALPSKLSKLCKNSKGKFYQEKINTDENFVNKLYVSTSGQIFKIVQNLREKRTSVRGSLFPVKKETSNPITIVIEHPINEYLQ